MTSEKSAVKRVVKKALSAEVEALKKEAKAAKPAAEPKKKAADTEAKAAKARPKPKAASKKPADVTKKELKHLIAVAAYHRAEKRGFAPGYELQDWLDAEAEISAMLGSDAS
ncbi:DUF2934 domain-containing protein [Parasulfuritortus cantonensis]|uniref:DUF2934 domain-containing protein n=1 Tax=Parasulfuritortus cantonensis TaxID=2528202 RepID=UPI00197EF772|nr:DUF2934 domain-containing protein [Parasulfuritortus cantonensis]